MKLYKYVTDPLTNENSEIVIQRTSDKAFVPIVSANRDGKLYLDWIAQGNTPDAAE